MPCVEIGWSLVREAWGQGFATEAARAAVGFNELGFQVILSYTVPANVRSRRVMERLGMRHDPVGGWALLPVLRSSGRTAEGGHPTKNPAQTFVRSGLNSVTLGDGVTCRPSVLSFR